MPRKTVIYSRVSGKDQSQASQLPDLQRYAESCGVNVAWFEDTFTGRSMKRPGIDKLMEAVRAGEIERIVCWRLDRLGRTASGLSALFAELERRGVGLVSVREGLDLFTPAGRLLAHVIASVAQYETEIRAERVKAGQDAARQKGKRWGGSKVGRRLKVTREKEESILWLHSQGKKISAIARAVALSRPTVYAVLDRCQDPHPKPHVPGEDPPSDQNRPSRMPQDLRGRPEEGSDTPDNSAS